MNILKTEKLKKIVEALGYEVHIGCESNASTKPVVWYNKFNTIGGYIFNPEENPSQLYEIEEWLLDNYYEFFLNKKLDNTYAINLFMKGEGEPSAYSEGKTRAEAVLNAMIEVIENEQRSDL